MTAKGHNFYEIGLADEGEAARLQALQAPAAFTRKVLGSDLAGTAVLDVGAGTNLTTGQQIIEDGGFYTAVDVWQGAVEAQRSTPGAEAAQGSILDLWTALPGRRFHIGHARNVICHLPAADRSRAITELLKICDRVVIIEYIGCAVRGTPGARDFQTALQGIFYEPSVHFQPFMERELMALARGVAGEEYDVHEWRQPLPPGDHFETLISAGQHVIRHSIQGINYLIYRMERAITLLQKKQEAYRSGTPYELYGPDLIAADIRRKDVTTTHA